MKIYNTLSQKKEEFKPVEDGKVKMYVCGPTVYDVGHLGHALAAVSMDIVRRYFIYKGFDVTYVSNITDVDDKMIKRAAKEKITEKELAAKIIPEYEKDYGALKVLPPDHQPRATEYISQMVALVEKLIEAGAAYSADCGIYFEVSKFAEYGKLSHKKLEDLQAGARIDVDEKKKNPQDFALWKKAKEGEPVWPGPAGMDGRPGWHIECSAMSMDLLGETFDIHGGGIDLQFPHHENEIAQSEMATGKPFANYWLHNGHIRVDNEKMAKSLGNFFTIKEIFEKYNPVVVRFFLLSTHYRMPVDFTHSLLDQAKNGLERLHDFMRRLNSGASGGGADVAPLIDSVLKKFEQAMDDDFEISKAFAAIYDFVKEINSLLDKNKLSESDVDEVLKTMRKLDEVLAILEIEKVEDSGEIDGLIKERNKAREEKDFARADEIRDELKGRGIVLEDTAGGTVWKKEL